VIWALVPRRELINLQLAMPWSYGKSQQVINFAGIPASTRIAIAYFGFIMYKKTPPYSEV
jgi:hypothetical protein